MLKDKPGLVGEGWLVRISSLAEFAVQLML